MYPAWATIPSGTSALFSESPDPIMSGTITRNRDDKQRPEVSPDERRLREPVDQDDGRTVSLATPILVTRKGTPHAADVHLRERGITREREQQYQERHTAAAATNRHALHAYHSSSGSLDMRFQGREAPRPEIVA